MALDFGPPPNDPVTSFVDESPDFTCEVCNTPLIYSGRGRKPKFCDEHKSTSKNTTRTGSPKTVPDKELAQACDNLRLMYETALMPLMVFSPSGAAVWATKIDALDQSNRQFLANNRDLVKRINSAGNKGGTFGFIAAHVFAILPVAGAIRMDLMSGAAQRAERRAAETPDDAQVWETVSSDPYVDPDAMFGNG